MDKQALELLLIEDSADDAELCLLELKRGGYDPYCHRVETAVEFAMALDAHSWDVILSDYSLPRFSVAEALRILEARQLDIPFILVSATIGEEAAVAAMKAGARDFVMKQNIGRLVPAVEREIREAQLRRERRVLEEKLRETQKLESLGLLAGGVAHDFNNLLTGILGNASLAVEMWDPPEPARSMLRDVINAGERAAELTRQLLAYAGKGRFFIQPMDFSGAVREVAGLMRSSLPRTVELSLELAEDLPPLEGDASQVRQLVMNLVMNAGEAIGNAHGRVVVSTGMRELTAEQLQRGAAAEGLLPGPYLCLEVRDNGCGMDEETRRQIFDPFFTTKFIGRGLGLAAARGIVRSHRGIIEVESEPGKGSVFRVLLPAAEMRKPAPPPAKSLPAPPANGACILVVDDEEVIRRTARTALESSGFGVIEARDGAEGVRLFSRNRERVALVLLDLTMPHMPGEEAFREMKRIRPDAPILVSSGYDEQDSKARFPGSVDFIHKPYTAAGLVEKVHQTLRAAAGA